MSQGIEEQLVPMEMPEIREDDGEIDIGAIRFVDSGIATEADDRNRPLRQFSPPGNLELYNVRYRRIGIEDWQRDAPFISEHARFWSSRDEFQPQKFSENIESLSSLWNSWGFMVAFYVNMLQLCCAFGVSIADGKTEAAFGSEIFASLLIPTTLLICLCAFGMVLPGSDLRVGIVVGILVTVLASVFDVFVGFAWGALFGAVAVLAGVLFLLLSRRNIEYSTRIYMFVNQLFFRKAVNLCFLVVFVAFALVICLLHFYVSAYILCCAHIVTFLRVGLFCFYLVVQWWSILAIGNAVYMAASATAVKFYFLAGTAYERQNPIIECGWNAMTRNFGAGAKAALLLPFFEVPKEVARFDESRTRRYRLVHRIVFVLRLASIEFAKRIDAVFSYPSRYGMIYSAVFNVGMKEGCRRYAENCSKYYINLLNEECSIGSVLCFKCFNAAVLCGLLDAGLSKVMGFSGDWMNAFFGFFSAFSIFHIYRSTMRGVYEGLFVAFSEEPARLERVSNDLRTVFESKFNEAVTRRRNILEGHFH